MGITEEQYECIKHCFPVQRSNVKLSDLEVVNVFCMWLSMAANGGVCPRGSGSGRLFTHRVRRWSREGVLDEILQTLHDKEIIRVGMKVVSLDSTIVKVHPDGTGALRSSSPHSIGKSRGGWTTKIHMIAIDDRTALAFEISPGQDHDAPVGVISSAVWWMHQKRPRAAAVMRWRRGGAVW